MNILLLKKLGVSTFSSAVLRLFHRASHVEIGLVMEHFLVTFNRDRLGDDANRRIEDLKKFNQNYGLTYLTCFTTFN